MNRSVAPLVGVWIETDTNVCEMPLSLSLPSWECGLKPNILWPTSMFLTVAPLVGVWIETSSIPHSTFEILVAPLVGVWIETFARNLKCS